MIQDYYLGWAYAGAFMLAGALFVLTAIGLSHTLRKILPPKRIPERELMSYEPWKAPMDVFREKYRTYESGEIPTGQAWIQFDLRFYIFALLFVVFDVEALFIVSWAVVFRSLGIFGLIEMMLFLAILILGLVYAWKKGALKWI